MKNKTLMKTLSALLAVVMVLCSAPLSGFVGLEFPEIKLPEWNLFDFGVEAEAASASITATASKTILSEGEIVTVTVNLNSSLEISGVDFVLSYDSAKLEYLSSSVGVIGDAFILSGVNHVKSTIRGAFLNSDASINTTTGTLAIIRFKVIAKANTTTTLGLSATATDSVSSVVPVNTQGTTLQIFKQSETGAFSTREHNIIEFGSYPQSEIKDEALLSSLNNLELEWISYGYFSGTGNLSDGIMTSDDYMKYADVFYNGEKYRAVKFTKYRPQYTGEKNSVYCSNQDDNGYYIDTVYWFKFEPVKWRALDLDKGLVISETLIDAQPYNNTVYFSGSKYYQDTTCLTYANNYANSSIREWLNSDFYNTAFTSDEKEQLLATECDNSAYDSDFDSETTYDNIFLLSYEEFGLSYSDITSVDLSKEQWLTIMCTTLGYEFEDAVQLCVELKIIGVDDLDGIDETADTAFVFDTLKKAATVLGIDYAKVVAESIKQGILNNKGELAESTENRIDAFYAILGILKDCLDNKVLEDTATESIYNEEVVENEVANYLVDDNDDISSINAKGVISKENITHKGSDYAKCQGLWTSGYPDYHDNSCWWLRSPGNSSFSVCEVNYSGDNFDYQDVSFTQNGVRPALTFASESETFKSFIEEDYYIKGTCGENLTYILHLNGDLTIEGEGEMADYLLEQTPWYDYRSYIKRVMLADTVTTIGDYAFADCDNLEDITITGSVISIGEYALYNTALYNNQNNWIDGALYIDNCLIEVNSQRDGSYAIAQNTRLIADGSFVNCNMLKEVTVPNTITHIGNGAFDNRTDLICINYEGTELEWQNISIDDGNSILSENVIFESNSERPYYAGSCGENANWILYTDGELIITGSGSVTSAPWKKENVKSLTINEGITDIGGSIFKNCVELSSIDLPEGLISMGKDAFFGCSLIEKIILPESLVRLGEHAFAKCSKLNEVIINCVDLKYGWSVFCCSGKETNGASVVFTNKVQSIKDDLFSGDCGLSECGGVGFNLASVTIGENVSKIGNHSFSYCGVLDELIFNARNCSYESDSVFSNTSIINVSIGDKVERIPEYFVTNCNALTEITIPETVTEIGKYAFSNCENLENVVFLGKNKIDVGDNIFDYSPKATICCKENSYMHSYADINVIRYCIIDEANNPNYEIKNEVLISYKGNAENIYLNSVNRIGFGAFAGNKTLKHIELSSGIDRVYDTAFLDCENLETVIIPKSVTSIGENAFDGCDELTIYCYAGSYAETYAKEQGINYEYITLDLTESKVEIYSDEEFNLGTSYNIDMVDAEEVLWVSNDESIVKVAQNGKITAVGEGTATVTAKTESGLEAECAVTVKAGKRPIVEGVIVSDFSVSYKGTTKIEPDVKYVGDLDYTFEYSSSNESVATVDKDGNVTATGTGEAEITVTVTDEYGNVVEDACKVTVSYAWWQWLIIIFLFGWMWY